MSSSSEFAAGPGSSATKDSGGDEPEASKVDAGFDDLRRESAAMLRSLADKYDTESEDSRARSARLLAESEAAGSLAVQLAEESVRIRAEADRLAAQPTWLSSAPDATAESKIEPSASTVSGAPDTATAVGMTTGGTTEPDATAQPGPGPARGFAPNVGSSTEGGQLASAGSAPTSAASATSPTLQDGTSGTGSPASPTGESDDWAPRPFESWRNEASQVTPRLLEL